MTSLQIKSISDNFNLGECPNWLEISKTLLQVDAFVSKVVKINPETKQTEILTFGPETVTFALPCASNPESKFLFSKDRKFLIYDGETKDYELLGTVEEEITDVVTRFNDGKCDSKGRLWAGTMALESRPTVLEPNRGSVYCYSPKEHKEIQKKDDMVTLSNGLDWSIDNKRFFFTDTNKKTIAVYEFNEETGDIANKQILVDFNKSEGYSDCGFPDGMCRDQNGNIWVACYDAARVINIDTTTGAILRKIDMPTSKITSCCFGGEDYSQMFVTTAWAGMSSQQKAKETSAGCTFQITGLCVKGVPSNLFNDL